MTRNKKALLAAVLGAAALAASAASMAQPRVFQQDQERGTYLGLSAGRAQYTDTCKGVTIPCDNSDSAWRFFAGHQFNRHLGAELGFSDLGAASGSDASGGLALRYKATAWDLSGVVFFPLAPSFSLLAKLGLHRTEVKSSGNVGTFTGSATEKGGGLVYGLGAQFNIGRLGLRAEWSQYNNVGGGNVGEDDISTFTAGVLYKF